MTCKEWNEMFPDDVEEWIRNKARQTKEFRIPPDAIISYPEDGAYPEDGVDVQAWSHVDFPICEICGRNVAGGSPCANQ